MNTKKIILIVIAAIAIIGGGTATYLWNKPHRTAEDEKPFATVTANDLFNEFSADETAAFAKYQDKVIQVSGVVEEIKADASGNTDIVLTTEDILGKVICTLKVGATAQGAEVGTTVELKGICNGFLSDVLLNQGVVVNNQKSN